MGRVTLSRCLRMSQHDRTSALDGDHIGCPVTLADEMITGGKRGKLGVERRLALYNTSK